MTTNPWTWADIGGVDIVFGLFSLAVFVLGIGLLIEYRRLALSDGTLSGSQLLGTFAAIPLALALGWIAYGGANDHRLLRGECRYTVARVYENWRYKGDEESRFEFWVAGEQYRFDERMSWRGGWRPLHSRWYVRYAVPDPNVYKYLDRSVPDSVGEAPPNGWARLPDLPLPPAPPAPAPVAPAPLTGPAASPVFQAAPADSGRGPAGRPFAAPVPLIPKQP